MVNFQIVLASASPRRQQLLGWVIEEFTARPADIDETPEPDEDPLAYCERMAVGKAAAAVSQKTDGEEIILASDTTVFLDKAIYGKPRNTEHAIEILHRLQGRRHTVGTAVAILKRNGTKLACRSTLCSTEVTIRSFTENEIEAYVASGDPMGKAGAYAIQNGKFHPVESIHGCYACVMGLPLCHTELLFNSLEIEFPHDFSQRCKAAIPYPCPIEKQEIRRSAIVKQQESEYDL